MNERPNCPAWVNAVFESLYAEVDSGSGLQWLFDEEEQELIFAPPVVQLQGGARDGAEVYSFYHVQLNSIFMLFDKPPAISFSTRDNECSIEGTVNGAHAWITFQKHPFEDQGPSEKQSSLTRLATSVFRQTNKRRWHTPASLKPSNPMKSKEAVTVDRDASEDPVAQCEAIALDRKIDA